MPFINNLPIMPKEARASMSYSIAPTTVPYPQQSAASQRNAAIWSTSDDEILLRARASGLNWQPIASRNFPNKTANACRKRHERLIERRHVDDWDHQKLELLASEYLACRKEMWEILAARLGERWNVVEAKCMEKGLKTLQTTARTAQRKASAEHQSHQQQAFCSIGGSGGGAEEDRGISDHNSDSGIVLSSGSEPDMEATDERRDSVSGSITRHHGASASWSESYGRRQHRLHQEHLRSRSLPLPLPQYQPPAQAVRSARDSGAAASRMHTGVSHLGAISYDRPNYALQRYSPETQQRLSIQSVLSPLEPHENDLRHGQATSYERDGQDKRFR